ncbi:MAG: S9 family peptidase [Candidatus Latescibacteria bacterium]|nr:S9 family peptidase [Candidatus Latescibacterota bacterium]
MKQTGYVKKAFTLSLFAGMLLIIFPASAEYVPESWTPESMIRFKRVGSTDLSPDGRFVAYTVSTPLIEGEQSDYLTHIWIASTDGAMDYQFTRGEKSCSDPSFSPDGKYLAFLSSRSTDGKTQVWISPLSGGDAEQITIAESGVNAYVWSPDSRRIAYTMDNPETEKEKQNKKEKRDMQILDTNYKYSHLYTATVSNETDNPRKVQRLTAGDFHVMTFDWSPDGRTIVFGHQPNPSPDEWLQSDIACVPSDSGEVKQLVQWEGTDRYPRYSPDGKWIAFASDGGEPNWALLSDIYIISSLGGKPKKCAETPDRSFTYYGSFIGWSADSSEIYIMEANHTFWNIIAVPANGGKSRVFSSFPGTYTGTSLSRDGETMAFVYQTSDEPPNVYVSGTKVFSPRKLTNINAGFRNLPMGKTEVITWKSGKYEIEGILTYPLNYEKGKRYPLILNVHGGPHSFFRQTFTGESGIYPIQAFAQEGYVILRPNPRGSSGYGKDFRYANINDWGFGDYDDLMAGVDYVIKLGIADPDRLCVMGWSYGGYMTSFIVTKTDRFKAASMGAGLSNLMSFTGTTDIPSFIPNYFNGEYWDNMETYMKHSANFHVDGVSTPTQVLHGENDKRVPLSQGIEFYHALKRQDCPTEMIMYPRTPHGPREPKFIQDVGERIIAWFNMYVER